jgi:hypothetical protein
VGFTLAFALQLRKKQGKTSGRVEKNLSTSARLFRQYVTFSLFPVTLHPLTAFPSVTFLPQSLHIVSTVCIISKSSSKVTLGVARFTAERHCPVGAFPAS